MTIQTKLYATGAATGALYLATAGAAVPETVGDWLLLLASLLQVIAGVLTGRQTRP